MIPKIYDKNESYIGLLPDVTRGIVIEERNGMFEAELEYQLFSPNWDKLVRGNIIVVHANDTLLNQKFRIYKVGKTIRGKFTVFAKHISYDMQRDMIEGLDISNQSCEYCLNMIFRNSQFSQKFKGYSNIINAQNFKIGPTKLLSAIGGTEGSIIDTFGNGAELLRDNENIHVLNKRGNDNGVIIEYAENLTGLDITEDEDGLITRIRAKAKYTPDGGEETEIFVYVDSSHISEYETPFISEIDFSDEFKDGEIPTVEKLTKLGQAYFRDNKCDIFEGNYKIQFIPLSKCAGYEDIEDKISLCDTVTIKDYRYNLDTKAKVIKATYDFLCERYESMEVGQPRTTLGDVVGGSDSNKGEQGPPGPQGPPGKDGDIENFPDTLPSKPVLNTKLYGFASIELSWTYENKVYYNYELYASKTKDFTPNVFDIIHAGQTSSFLFQAKPNETWYFRVCAVNSYGKRTAFSDQITVTTTKVDDLTNYFETAAIGQAVVGSLTADYMTAGIIKGHWIDAKNLSVTDGNGVRTLDIDSGGNVALNVTTLKINSSDVATKSYTNTYATNAANNAVGAISLGGENLLKNTDYNVETITSYYSASNDALLQRVQYTFGNSLASDMFIRNDYVLRNRYDIATAISNNVSYSMTTWRENVTLEPNTEYTLSMYLYKGANCGETYFAVYPIVDGKIGTRVCKSDSVTSYTGGFVKLSKTFNTGSESTTFSVRIYNYRDTSKTTGNSDIVIYHPMLEKGNKESQWTASTADMVTTIEMDSKIEQNKESILLEVSKNYATTSSLSSVDGKFANYSTTKQMNSAINTKADSILSTVSSNYATKTTVTNLSNNLTNNYSTTTQMNSAINQKADSITSSVSSNYATKKELSNVDGKFDSYSTTTQMNSAITQKANEINATVSKVEQKARTNYVNQVVNSDCLNSIEGWYTPHSDKISTYITTSNKPESKNAIRLDCRESRVYMNSKKFPVSPGETYTVSMWGQRQPYNSFLRMYMMFSDNDTADNNYFDTYSYKTWSSNDGDNTWVYKSMTVTVPDGASYAFIKVGAESTQTTTDYDGRGYFCSLMCNKGDEAATWTGNTNDSYIDLNSRVSSAEVKISDTISSTVRKDNIISSINQSAEAVKVKAKKIELNGAVTIADSNGDSVKIDDADYSIMNGSTERGFFGLRKLDDDRKIARLAMSHSGLDKSINNYFVATTYPKITNPLSIDETYFDIAYRCQKYTNETGCGDVSNIRMIGDGTISVSPIKELNIYTNYVNGSYTNKSHERLIATFESSPSQYFDQNLIVPCVRRKGGGTGLILGHYNDNNQSCLVRVGVDTSGFRAFRPVTSDGNISLGSANYPFEKVTTLKGTYSSAGIVADSISTMSESIPHGVMADDDVIDNINFIQSFMIEDMESQVNTGLIMDVTNIIGTNYVDASEDKVYLNESEMIKLLIKEIQNLKHKIKTISGVV